MNKPKPEDANPNFLCVDSKNTGIENYPSTHNQAIKVFTEFLEYKFSEGWEFIGIRPYNLGVEQREMYVFKNIK